MMYLILLIVVLFFVIYPLYYNYKLDHSKNVKRNDVKKEDDLDLLLRHLHQKSQALINHVQLRRSLFNLTSNNPKNLIVIQDYILLPTSEKSHYNHSSKTIFLHVYDESEKHFKNFDVLLLDVIECICTMTLNYDTRDNVDILRRDLREAVFDNVSLQT